MEHLPLRIDFSLVTPWCPPALGLHFDGLIAWAAVQEAELQGRVFESYDEILSELPFGKHEVLSKLPFGKHETCAGWVWKASLVRPVKVLGSERRYITAKTSSTDMAMRMSEGKISGRPLKSIDTVRGPFKNDAFWYTVEHVDACTAFCVGDPERISALLDHVTNLGKRGRLDHGRIDMERTVIVEDTAALDRWQERQMPKPIEGYVPVMGRLQPPYWMGEGATTVWRPL